MYKDILILLSLSIEHSLFCKLDAVRDRFYFLLVLYYKTKPIFSLETPCLKVLYLKEKIDKFERSLISAQ